MIEPTPRKRIGRFNDVATRQVIYQTDYALEIDEIDQFQIARRRVYFDDILLVTMHSRVGVGFAVTMSVFAVLLLSIAAALQYANEATAAMWFGASSAPFILGLATRLLLKQDVITVYGRRSKAAMRFTFRKTYALEKFQEICDLARSAQDAIAAEVRAATPAPVVAEYPMPPVETPETNVE
jgi:hypothetical protein